MGLRLNDPTQENEVSEVGCQEAYKVKVLAKLWNIESEQKHLTVTVDYEIH